MLKDTIYYYERSSFLERQMYKLKVNGLIKKCDYIKEKIKGLGDTSSGDRKINIIMPESSKINTESVYLLVKGYNKDGSIKPTKKYTLVDAQVVEADNNINSKVAVLDLYEKSVYLYDFEKDDNYITGYIVKEESSSNNSFNLIFTKEKVRILLKNTNAVYEYSSVDSFIEKYYM